MKEEKLKKSLNNIERMKIRIKQRQLLLDEMKKIKTPSVKVLEKELESERKKSVQYRIVIARLRNLKTLLEEIAEDVGRTRERVRQILKDCDITGVLKRGLTPPPNIKI